MTLQKPEFIRVELVRAVLDGDFGERIPREEDLAEAFGVSRGTARSAILDLRAHDVVTVTHGRPGATVRPPREWSLFDAPLLDAVLDSSIGREVLTEALECMSLVAPEAAALAADRATDAELQNLGERLERVLSARRPARLGSQLSPELEFHLGVIEACHNRFLARVATTIETALAGRVKPGVDGFAHQQRILDALIARDPAAARDAMRTRIDALVPARRRRAHR
jgi:GntR family transcriptional regulator, galactonate operon transcriptional repressor